MPKKNVFISLFASVQLAIFLLFILAATSIIGTLIPQNNIPDFYIHRYGARTAHFFQLLNITDMYNSWWFLTLLGLFSLNLIVCSLERLPHVLRMIRRNILSLTPKQVRSFPMQRAITLDAAPDVAIERVRALFTHQGWSPKTADKDGETLLAAEKGGWSRLGVYVVHGSILIILIGAAIGSSTVAEKILHQPTFAYKGSIMLPEGQATNHVIAFKRGTHIDLGFHLHCDDFSIEYYANGMPKTYRSAVSILEQGKVVRKGAIEVNHPLTYKGVTFYQSSYQPYQQYRVVLQRQQDGLETKDIVTTAQEVNWPQGGVSYGIVNRESRGEVTGRLKIWFSDGKGDPSIFWVQTGQEALVKRSDTTYRLVIDQLYATGLQATKDPGVGLVYGGCVLMLAGLYVAFFLSHRRLFALIRPDGQGCRIFFAGDANKNRIGFEKKFSEFINKLEH